MAAPDSGLSLPRRLASVDKKVRDRAVDLLERWLASRQSLAEPDLKKIWKGLFYCYWHSDKSRVQSELADRFSSLLLRIPAPLAVQFFAEFMGTMRREWGGIDHLRLDKFCVLQRRFISGMLRALERSSWEKTLVAEYMQAIKTKNLLAGGFSASLGSSMHLAEVFIEEVGRVTPKVAEVLGLLLEPFYEVLATSHDKLLVTRVTESVFGRLLEMAAKREVLGEMVLQLPVASKLFGFASAPGTFQGNRKILYSLHESFKRLSKGLGDDKQELESKSPGVVHENDAVISKLEARFDDVASPPPLEVVLSPLIVGSKKKAKSRRKSPLENASSSAGSEVVLGAGDEEKPHLPSPSPGETPGSGEEKKNKMKSKFVSPINTASKKRKSSTQETPEIEANTERKKKVRFALKQNAVWQVNNPRAVAPKRFTPSTSSTPKASALKKGLAPGPIKVSPKSSVSPRNRKRSPRGSRLGSTKKN